jgi:riboflavin biosynthesis pyrimidine reductase
MKPYVICHMVSSLDGRIWSSRWRPSDTPAAKLFEPLHDQLEGDAWLVGRVTGREFAKGDTYPARPDATFPREAWFARRDAASYGIVLDAHGKIAWARSDIGGDPIVVVLTEQVADSHLAGLRSDGVSYIFAGKTALDLRLALEIVNRELGVKRLLLEGGGVANGEFLRAGLVDEISLVIAPAIDGAKGGPHVYDSRDETAGPLPLRRMTLQQCQELEGGAVWLRYKLENA